MKKIVLLCAGGMSTSILVNKMKDHAKTIGEECDIAAYAVESLKKTAADADAVLIGPQVGHRLSEIQSQLDCPVAVIDMVVYGMMDGKSALNQALKLIGD
ncbi:PTS sugar transporter subunit IIB [Erysipelothrix larvae]|uniref:PTS sugar transporter subunit IIB n=1 Tax=Erysipelothrix larvae TaxID=1514105 RepID=A0A109UHL2_9FIRM|nr:PTS sugar transporter subunit IIB [Erysipelothrix larvae]AMC94303.1 PTS sugar transporter subunit IIB [Erysipelothrix larvae]